LTKRGRASPALWGRAAARFWPAINVSNAGPPGSRSGSGAGGDRGGRAKKEGSPAGTFGAGPMIGDGGRALGFARNQRCRTESAAARSDSSFRR
jgi:hypothetical protein